MSSFCLVNITLLVLVVLFVNVVIMDFYSSRYFKKHESDYKELLSEYRQKGFDLDLVTNYASFFGSLANYQKIIWFVRLYKGVRMKFTHERFVQEEAYKYVQSLPPERISWMLELHHRYKLQGLIFTLWLIVGLLFIVVVK